MSINLIEAIQQTLHYPPLQKIDPNTQEVIADETKPDEHRFSQAAIPVVLIGLYKYAIANAGAENLLSGGISTDWVSQIFSDHKNEIVQKVASYSFQSTEEASRGMKNIAGEAVRLIRENIKPPATIADVKDFMLAQRSSVLSYLPQALHTGDLLNDTTIDDNTNKMEGPVSGLMHKIGAAFSKPD